MPSETHIAGLFKVARSERLTDPRLLHLLSDAADACTNKEQAEKVAAELVRNGYPKTAQMLLALTDKPALPGSG